MKASTDFADLFGYYPDQMEGCSLQLLDGLNSGSRSIDDLIKSFAVRKHQSSEMSLCKRDGTRLQVMVNVSCQSATCDMDSVATVSVLLCGSPFSSGDRAGYRETEAMLQDSVGASLKPEIKSLQRSKRGQEQRGHTHKGPATTPDAILDELRIMLSHTSCQVFPPLYSYCILALSHGQ